MIASSRNFSLLLKSLRSSLGRDVEIGERLSLSFHKGRPSHRKRSKGLMGRESKEPGAVRPSADPGLFSGAMKFRSYDPRNVMASIASRTGVSITSIRRACGAVTPRESTEPLKNPR